MASPPLRQRTLAAALLAAGLVWGLPQELTGQTTAPQQDPLMSLMLSQPRMDFSGPILPEVSFDPPIVRPGETAYYRITLNALEDSVTLPEKLPAPVGLELRRSGSGQVLQPLGTNLVPRTSINYRAVAAKMGTYEIPGFAIAVGGRKAAVPAARLIVAGTLPPNAARAQVLKLELSSTNVYVGQAIRARLIQVAGPDGAIQGLQQVQFRGEGLIADQTTVRQSVQTFVGPGQPHAQSFVYETLLTPIQSGKLSVFAQAHTFNRFGGGVVITGPAMITGSHSQFALLDSDPVEVNVKPVPPEGKLPGFTGAVGSLQLDPPVLSANRVRVGEPLRLQVRVRGDANLGRLVPPRAPLARDWQVFPATEATVPPQAASAMGFAVFQYTLIPLEDEAVATPVIPFSVFDPTARVYRDLSIPAVPVEVDPGVVPVDAQAMAQAEAATRRTNAEPALSSLARTPGPGSATLLPAQQRAWFPIVQLAPGLVFVGLIAWDRRRRFLEQHPEILLRRRARRALARERRAMRKAAAAGRGEPFATAAVRAFRVACAPHFPAEPRALVGSDVLALLPETIRENPEGLAVRKLFAQTDAASFAEGGRDLDSLPGLQPALDTVLERLNQLLKA